MRTSDLGRGLDLTGQDCTRVTRRPGRPSLGLECAPGRFCDEIVLVGKSDRTNGLSAGVNNQKKVHWINSIRDLQTVLKTLNLKNPVVLLENDLPDNY